MGRKWKAIGEVEGTGRRVGHSLKVLQVWPKGSMWSVSPLTAVVPKFFYSQLP